MRRSRLFYPSVLSLALLAASLSYLPLKGTTSDGPELSRSEDSPGERSDGALLIYAPALPASAQNPAFAPSGDTVLFTIFFKGYNAGPAGLYRVSLADGSRSALLYEPDYTSVNLPGSSWNAATGRIAFASDRQDKDEIWTMGASGQALFRVTHHGSGAHFIEPSFSPDGQWIVFESAADGSDNRRRSTIWKVRADGTGLTRLTAGETDDRQPNWSPRGDRILIQRREANGGWNLYTMLTDGTGFTQVTTGSAENTDASWSPDAGWIVYSSDYGDLAAPNIFIVSASGGTPIHITRDDNHEDGAPSWSPDGKWIAFESHRDSSASTPSTLWRIAVPTLPASS